MNLRAVLETSVACFCHSQLSCDRQLKKVQVRLNYEGSFLVCKLCVQSEALRTLESLPFFCQKETKSCLHRCQNTWRKTGLSVLSESEWIGMFLLLLPRSPLCVYGVGRQLSAEAVRWDRNVWCDEKGQQHYCAEVWFAAIIILATTVRGLLNGTKPIRLSFVVFSSFRRPMYGFFPAGVRRGISVVRTKQGFRASNSRYTET